MVDVYGYCKDGLVTRVQDYKCTAKHLQCCLYASLFPFDVQFRPMECIHLLSNILQKFNL